MLDTMSYLNDHRIDATGYDRNNLQLRYITGFTDPPEHYRPTSAHFRLRSLDTDSGESTPVAGCAKFEVPPPQSHVQRIMEAANRHSTSPEDCSDGNEPTSAPSEFLAEVSFKKVPFLPIILEYFTI